MNHLREAWRRLAVGSKLAATNWRGFADSPIWREHDAVIMPQERGRGRYYEVYTYGEVFGHFDRLDDAKNALWRIYGDIKWEHIKMPKVWVEHYYFGWTDEFTDPTNVYVAKLPRLGKARMHSSALGKMARVTPEQQLSKVVRLAGSDIVLTYHPTDEGDDDYWRVDSVEATRQDDGYTLGWLNWYSWGEIETVRVVEWFRRQGLATAMLEFAREVSPVPIIHSNDLSEAGAEWARAVGVKVATKTSAVYYHGTGRGGDRAMVGKESWDNRFFVSHDPEVAALYGPDVREVRVSPSARILQVRRPGAKQWVEYAGFSERASMLDVAIGIVERAESEGYDIVEFYEPHDFIGHVILNERVVESGGR